MKDKLQRGKALLQGLSIALIGSLGSLCPGTASLAAEDAGAELPGIEVIGYTPLSSNRIALHKYSGNIQTLSAADIERGNPQGISELLTRNISSIGVNTTQDNPYQDDIFYRGFLASPLLGSAIGLSVYMDGVRINEGFGDTINWDLIPISAITHTSVIPGSNPLFGLNTLGGAIALQTKSGRSFQGTELKGSAGSWQRRSAGLEHGGYYKEYDWYTMVNVDNEEGWRTLSPSKVRQIFSKLGWRDETNRLDISYHYSDNDLTGNGLSPQDLLDIDRDAPYTYPDNTENRLHFITLNGQHRLHKDWQLASNIFYRNYKRTTFNGDAEIECEDNFSNEIFTDNQGESSLAASLCEGTVADAQNRIGGTLFDDNGNPLQATAVLEREAGGEDRTTETSTDTYGISLESTLFKDLFGYKNQFTLAVEFSRNSTRFIQREAEGELFVNGNSVGILRTDPFETEVDLKTEQENLGAYFRNTTDLTQKLSMTASARVQDVKVELNDQSGENPDLNGKHDFFRFSPAAGLTYRATPAIGLHANYSEGFRVPTAAELSCADEDDPCNLPNAFVADPPLSPVVARTIELGARGRLRWGTSLLWRLSLYQTRLHDDLLFTLTETGGAGFFQNVGNTLRRGVELGILGQYQRLSYFINYAFTDASFENNVQLASVVEADGVAVNDGDSIPGIPQHNLNLGVEYQLLPTLWIGGDMLVASGSYLRGDEGNELPETRGYAIFNLNARMTIYQSVELWAKLDNVLDKDYETVGARNFNATSNLIAGDEIEEARFLAPGRPRSAWLGVTFRF